MRSMSGLILEIVEGPGAGKQVPVEAPVEIGRADTATLVLKDPLVSRHHAIVEPAAGGLVVEDLGSMNGTFVNGNQIYSATTIHPDDQLLVGVTVLELRTQAAVAQRPSAARRVPPSLTRVAPAPTTDGTTTEGHVLDPLLDVHVKMQARAAPLALFLLVVIIVSILLTIR
jgi:pSer/pThr/pTyr-binding forkhead associated (FHA) protein